MYDLAVGFILLVLILLIIYLMRLPTHDPSFYRYKRDNSECFRR